MKRSPITTPVRIVALTQETPTVRSFRLALAGRPLAFLPGQWIDCYLDPAQPELVAGYSITSTPLDSGFVEIAVKNVGENPVTKYLHQSAAVGNVLYLDGGHGAFCYRPESARSLALVGGGIGITPLMSIIRYVARREPDVETTLIHSVRASADLLFGLELRALERRSSRLHYEPRVTGLGAGRVGRDDLARLETGRPVFYLCGPAVMVSDLLRALDTLGVPPERVKYERW